MPPEIANPGSPVYLAGDNWAAIIAAAVATYAIGALMYGLLFSKLWLQLTGYTREQLKPHMWKMPISFILPFLTAFGLALILKSAGVSNLATGLMITLQVWFFIVVPVRLYSFVYSPERPGLLVLDLVHLFLGTMVAGGIISAWV